MRNLIHIAEGIADDIDMEVHGGPETHEGVPYGDYRFEFTSGFSKVLTVYGGVNIPKHDKLVGLDTFYVVDITAYPTPENEFKTTNPARAYARGARLGPEVVRKILRMVLARVKADFPTVTKMSGSRLSGARFANNKRAASIMLPESVIHNFRNVRGNECTVFKNPTVKEFKSATKHDGVRAFLVGSDMLVWDTFTALHAEVRRAMSLPADAIPIMLYGDLRGREAHVVVTDNTKDTEWWHSAEVADVIREHPAMKRMFGYQIEVSYYDEDIVGDWRELDDEDEEDAA